MATEVISTWRSLSVFWLILALFLIATSAITFILCHRFSGTVQKMLSLSYRIFRAIISRIIYLIHAVLVLWRTILIIDKPWIIGALYIFFSTMFIEAYYSLKIRVAKEYKWWSPSTFCYLLAVVPSLLLLEIYSLEVRGALQAIDQGRYGFVDSNSTDHRDDTSHMYGTNSTVLENYDSTFSRISLFVKHFFMHHEEGMEFIIPYNESKSFEFKNNICYDGHSEEAQLEKEHEKTPKYGLHDEFCVCLTEKHYGYFVVHFGESFFTPLDRSTGGAKLVGQDSHRLIENEDHNYIVEEDDHEGSKNLAHTLGDSGRVLLAELAENSKFIGNFLDPRIEFYQLHETWRLLLQQMLVFVLVVTRWILPKGKISNSELSQLLLVYIATAADILEFLTETIDPDDLDIACNSSIHYEIWLVWAWSMGQFIMVMVASKDDTIKTFTISSQERYAGVRNAMLDSRINVDRITLADNTSRRTVHGTEDHDHRPIVHTQSMLKERKDLARFKKFKKTRRRYKKRAMSAVLNNYVSQKRAKKCFQTTTSFFNNFLKSGEIWSIFLILIFQDVPFLFIRYYLIREHGMLWNNDGSLNQMLIFFTAKNFLVILLQIYRIYIVYVEINNNLGTKNMETLQINILRETLNNTINLEGKFRDGTMDVKTNTTTKAIHVTITAPKIKQENKIQKNLKDAYTKMKTMKAFSVGTYAAAGTNRSKELSNITSIAEHSKCNMSLEDLSDEISLPSTTPLNKDQRVEETDEVTSTASFSEENVINNIDRRQETCELVDSHSNSWSGTSV